MKINTYLILTDVGTWQSYSKLKEIQDSYVFTDETIDDEIAMFLDFQRLEHIKTIKDLYYHLEEFTQLEEGIMTKIRRRK